MRRQNIESTPASTGASNTLRELKQEMELPLRVGPQIEAGIKLHSIRDADGSRIALEVFTPHAHQIVRAVNNHDKLREALQRLIQWADALEWEAAGTEGRYEQGPPVVSAIAALRESEVLS